MMVVVMAQVRVDVVNHFLGNLFVAKSRATNDYLVQKIL